jgi:hypothetical protein
MFIKTNLNAPKEYAKLRIRLTGFQNWDNIPTYVYLIIECLDSNDELLHTVAMTKALYTEMSRTDAILKDLPFILRILTKIPEPTENIEIQVSDLAPLLYLTLQAKAHYQVTRQRVGVIRNTLKSKKAICKVTLGDPKLHLDFDQYIRETTIAKRKSAPTLEQLGYKLEQFVKYVESRGKKCLSSA